MLRRISIVSSRAMLSRNGNINAAGGAYQEREQSAEKNWALKRDQEALEKLRAHLKKEETLVAEKHGVPISEIAAETPVPKSTFSPAFKHDPAAGQYITLNEFLEFRKEMIEKVRSVEDELIAIKYALKKK